MWLTLDEVRNVDFVLHMWIIISAHLIRLNLTSQLEKGVWWSTQDSLDKDKEGVTNVSADEAYT